MRLVARLGAAAVAATMAGSAPAIAQDTAGAPVPVIGTDAISWRLKDRFRLFDRAEAPARERVEAALEMMGRHPGDSAAGAIRPHYTQLLETLAGPEAESLRRSNWRWSRTSRSVRLRRADRRVLTTLDSVQDRGR